MQICNRSEESKRKVGDKRKKEEQDYHHNRKAHKIIRKNKKTYVKTNIINRRRSEA